MPSHWVDIGRANPQRVRNIFTRGTGNAGESVGDGVHIVVEKVGVPVERHGRGGGVSPGSPSAVAAGSNQSRRALRLGSTPPWSGLQLSLLARPLDNGRVYDRDLAEMEASLLKVIEAFNRRST